jgi:hypothetical protein
LGDYRIALLIESVQSGGFCPWHFDHFFHCG